MKGEFIYRFLIKGSKRGINKITKWESTYEFLQLARTHNFNFGNDST